jgi:RNA polymerase sigma-70 factor (ECF subfamily)
LPARNRYKEIQVTEGLPKICDGWTEKSSPYIVSTAMAMDAHDPEELSALGERVRQGDPVAESDLVRLFQKPIFLMLVTRTRDPEAARDLTQEVLLAVLNALRNGQLRASDKLSAFVHGTARNLANNHLRTQGQKPREIPLDPDLLLASPAVEGLEDKERSSLVQRGLEQLEPLDRRILLMTLADGLKPGKIAVELGLTPEAVRTRKSRAVKKVIEMVQKLSRKSPQHH